MELEKDLSDLIKESGNERLIKLWGKVRSATLDKLDDKVYNKMGIVYQTLEESITVMAEDPELVSNNPKLCTLILAAIRLVMWSRDDIGRLVELPEDVRSDLLKRAGYDDPTKPMAITIGPHTIRMSAEEIKELFNESDSGS